MAVLTMAALTVIVREALSLMPWVRAARKTGERRPRIMACAVKRTGGSSP